MAEEVWEDEAGDLMMEVLCLNNYAVRLDIHNDSMIIDEPFMDTEGHLDENTFLLCPVAI